MNFGFEKKKATGLGIDITPLVDTVFNLLIFFALSMNFIATSGIRVELPKVKSKELIPLKESVDIFVSSSGIISIEGKEIGLDMLEGILKDIKEKGTERAIIKADGRVFHEFVVRVLEAAKRAGFEKIAIATQTEKSPDKSQNK